MPDSPNTTADLSSADLELYDTARSASRRAYAKVSGLQVGAALRTGNDGTFVGCNVEDASLWQVLHAEQAAVFAAVADEGPGLRILDIAVYASADSVPPCGACRQLLCEFGGDIRVIFPFRGQIIVKTVAELLPFPFELDGI